MSGNIIISFLLAIGMTFLLWLLYKWLRESLSKKGFKEENERLVFFFVCGVICFFVNYLWLVPQVITGDVVKNVVDQQLALEVCQLDHFLLFSQKMTSVRSFFIFNISIVNLHRGRS